jgi:lactoylglutathione lyase
MIVLHTPNLTASRHYYSNALGFEELPGDCFACGTTVIALRADVSQRPVGAMRARGYRYLTVQVWDADAEYQSAMGLGALDGFAPRTMGDVARFGFVRDPDGNWMEISQRASLTGLLPPG